MVRLTDTGGEVRRQFVTGSRPVTLRFEPGDAVLDAVYTALRDARVQDLRPGTVRVTTSDCHDWLDLTLGDRELNLRYNGRGPQLLPEADYWNAVDALIHLGRVWPRRPVMVRLTVADVLPDGAWIDVGRLRHFQWHPIGLSGERRVVDLLLDCYDAQRMPPCMGPIDLRLHRPDQSAAVATIRLDPADAISHDVRLAIVDGAWQFTTE